jgi:glycyl-tRNA synthetase
MSQPLNFQQVILALHQFWANQGCAIWEPYNVQVGAGTGNPATLLRVLGPEPWRVAYVEPSVRPDDGRYGDNPNRMQKYYQYQVILKPDPGNPQELYLQSLQALGIDPRQHDIRFVEDNWESPALGAWGLGWEVWLDGQEITQFTYFQQAGGLELNPVSVEITYGIERIVLALQGKESAWDIEWWGDLTYRDMMFAEEVEHCRYYFDIADVDALKKVYDTYEREMARALEGNALISAYDYVLKCSHLFNVLDTRGAIGVTERASYFRRMRDMTRTVAKAYAANREALGHPLLKMQRQWGVTLPVFNPTPPPAPTAPNDLLLEVGVEELPAADVADVTQQLQKAVPELLSAQRLSYDAAQVFATPRRIVVSVKGLSHRQPDEEVEVKGPPAERAFNPDGTPTKAAEGFAKGKGLSVDDLRVAEVDGGRYVVATVKTVGRPVTEVLMEALPNLIAGIRFGKSMRWNETGVAFSRPIRWIVALYGSTVIPFQYAGVISGNVTRGLRPYGSPECEVTSPGEYFSVMAQQNIYLSAADRREIILDQLSSLAQELGASYVPDEGLLEEVVNLVEAPYALVGKFEPRFLELPRDVLTTVMRKKQFYFAVQDDAGALLPYFITVRNGDDQHLDMVAHGNEHVLRARFTDAAFFYEQDRKKPLKEHLQRLATLTFHEKLGSMKDKNERIQRLVQPVGDLLKVSAADQAVAAEAATILKADLGTQMVVEMTSLQGAMGREYARLEGYSDAVANAIYEHWMPRGAGDSLPPSAAGALLALIDKLDSLVGLFAAGLAPRSTADPFGLRRAALGVVQILIGRRLDVRLTQLVDLVAAAQPVALDAPTHAALLEFMRGRLESWLLDEQGVDRFCMNAVLAQQADNPYRASVGIQELEGWVQRPEWEVILDNFARCVRITRAEPARYPVHESLLHTPEEKALWQAYSAHANLDGGNVGYFLTQFEPIVPAIKDFFNNVLVNVDDAQVRQNRIGLLQAIAAMQDGHADLSQLSGF